MEEEKKPERRKMATLLILTFTIVILLILTLIVGYVFGLLSIEGGREQEQKQNDLILKIINQLEIDKETLQEENEKFKDKIKILQDHIQELEQQNNDSSALLENFNFQELVVKYIQDDTVIVVTKTGNNTLKIHGYGNKKKVLEDPTFLYFPNDSDYSEEIGVKLYFQLDLRPVFKDGWELSGTSPSGEEVTVISDSDNEHYYYLDLKEKGIYIMELKRDGDIFAYFALAVI